VSHTLVVVGKGVSAMRFRLASSSATFHIAVDRALAPLKGAEL
jgi:hypothetical protein